MESISFPSLFGRYFDLLRYGGPFLSITLQFLTGLTFHDIGSTKYFYLLKYIYTYTTIVDISYCVIGELEKNSLENSTMNNSTKWEQ